jgi:transcriptional regulator with XRE-family HTH domain
MVRAMDASGRETGTRLGAFVRGRRRAAGWTQRGLADAAGLSVGVVRDLEQGVSVRPHQASLERLAAALGLAPEEAAGWNASWACGSQRQGRQGTRAAGNGPAWEVAHAGPGGRSEHEAGSGDILGLRVLGPLVAWRDGVPVALGGGMQRAVLGLLAVHPGAVVSQEAIGEVPGRCAGGLPARPAPAR